MAGLYSPIVLGGAEHSNVRCSSHQPLVIPSKGRILHHMPVRTMAHDKVGVHVDVLGNEMD